MCPEDSKLHHDDERIQEREEDDSGNDSLLQDLVKDLVQKNQAECGLIPALQAFPSPISPTSRRKSVETRLVSPRNTLSTPRTSVTPSSKVPV